MMRLARRVVGWLPALVLVPLVLAGGVVLTRPDDNLAMLRSTLPLDPGTTWTYAVHDHDRDSGTLTTQVIGAARLLGTDGLVPAYRLQSHFTDFPGAGPRTTTTYLAIDGHTVRQEGLTGPNRVYTALDPPAVAYDPHQQVGDSMAYHGTLGSRDYDRDDTLESRGPVTVGGTTFDDCAHYRNRITVPSQTGGASTEEQVDQWDCPGIGPVRLSDRYDPNGFLLTEELTSFHGVSSSWTATAPPPVDTLARSTPPVAGAGIGFGSGRTYATDGVVSDALAWADERSSGVSFPPVSDGVVEVTGEPDGDVAARDLATGAVRWQVRLTGPILVTPAIADGVVILADAARRVWALSTTDGSARWVHHFDDVVSASPAVSDGEVAVATDDSRLTILHLTDGTTLWTQSLGGTSVGPPAAADGRLAVGDTGGSLTVYDLLTGHRDWSTGISDGPAAGPVLIDGRLLMPDDDGVVSSYDAASGRLQWESHSHGVIDAPISAGSGVVAVTVSGTLDVCDLGDGHRIWHRHLAGPGRPPVAIVGQQLVSVARSGQVTTYDLTHGTPAAGWRLPLPLGGPRIRVEVAPGLVGDDLVFSATLQDSPLVGSVLYAYPTGSDPDGGTLLRLDPRHVSQPSTEAPLEAGDDLVLPGIDQAVHLVDGSDHDHVLVRSTGFATGAVLADGLVVTRQDDQLVGVRTTGGDAVWRTPVGAPGFGAVPAVWHDRLFVGTSTGLLESVDASDGTVTWHARTAAGFSPTTPLALPDGDVVYGGGLARYDGATGRAEWALPDAQTFSPPAYGDGVVVAQLTRGTHPSGLYGIDAATGHVLWSHADQTPLYTGPAVGDGVVVSTDADGTVSAVDVHTGAPLWSLALDGLAGSVPYVVGDRVLLVELGRYEDFDQRDYRVSVHDLRTGAYLGSWQPPGAVLGIGVVAAPGDHGDLLVPTSAGEPLVVEVTPGD